MSHTFQINAPFLYTYVSFLLRLILLCPHKHNYAFVINIKVIEQTYRLIQGEKLLTTNGTDKLRVNHSLAHECTIEMRIENWVLSIGTFVYISVLTS